MRRLLLASRGLPGLRDVLRARGTRAILVPTAANPLGEPGIADEVEAALRAAGLEVARLDLDAAAPEAVRAVLGADVLAVSGGDPFHLLAAARGSGFASLAARAVAAGTVYVGVSAGAIVAGPTLEPVRLTSPFRPPAGLELEGLGLTEVLVLPHHDRPGRAARHALARERHGSDVRLLPLRDGEMVVDDGTSVTRITPPG